MSSWPNKKIIRKPKFKVITGNVIENFNNQSTNSNIISPSLGSNHREQIENFTGDDSINFDNLNLNIDNLGEQKIIIYDTENLSICASLTNIYSNKYTEIVVTNNLSSIINNNQLSTLLLLTIPNEENILELYKLKNISNFNIYTIISKYIELNSNTILFNISDNVIFSSLVLFNEYNKRYVIHKYVIENNILINHIGSKTFHTIFCENICSYLNTIYEYHKNDYNDLSNILETYGIYFPQFHTIEENNYTFYPGYTDMINLKEAKQIYNDLHTPLSGLLGYYDLKEQSYLIETQILMAKAYGLKGFAMYYYWFSQNTISRKNMLMNDVIDRFFDNPIEDFDFFFIWANESWSNNVHFNANNNNHKILNTYNDEELVKNIKNLIKYFKSPNYKKINNKPVLFIHNPEEFTTVQLASFHNLLNSYCISNNFNGIELVVYERNNSYKSIYQTYAIEPLPKRERHRKQIENISWIDYYQNIISYIEIDNTDNDVNGVLINYDNTARLLKHNNNHKNITRYYNNDINKFSIILNYCINKHLHKHLYKPVSKIFLVNAWNEWGEKMCLEPSNENGFKYLNLIQSSLLHLNNAYKKQIFATNYKINVNDYNIGSIIPTKYKYLYFDDFLKISENEYNNYDFLLIDYVRLPIITYKFFCDDLYKSKEDINRIEKKLTNCTIKKILLIHDLHDYTFDGLFKAFFNYCSRIKIDYISSLYSDNWEFKIIKSNLENRGIGVYVSPHLMDDTIYHNYNQNKEYDILFYGADQDKCYSFRKRLKDILINNKHRWRLRIVSYNELTKYSLSKEINKSYLSIATKSSFDYFLMKYIEIGLSHSLIAGDIPTQALDYNLQNTIVQLNENNTDNEIIDILNNTLSNKQQILEKTTKQYENFKYLQLKYKDYYYTLLFDKINKLIKQN